MNQKGFKDAVVDLWDALFSIIGINFVWFVLTILIIPGFPAKGGLYYATNQLAHGKSADLSTFIDGFKKYFWVSYKWGFINLFIYLVLASNIWFYGQYEGVIFFGLQWLFISLILIYTCIQMYTYPLLLEQDSPSIRNALRNSLIVFMRFIGRSLGLFAFFTLIFVVSVLVPPLWAICTVSIFCYFSNWQTITIIQEILNESKPGDE